MALEQDKRQLFEELRREIRDQRVVQAMERVPREIFVPPEHRHLAYADMPLPIGAGQTISQPLVVAMMTEALELKGGEKVLELGTGSGYQTAILAELAWRVISVERIPSLAEAAATLLMELGYQNVEINMPEMELGWREGAPYDAIIVTAGAPRLPQKLLDQLADGGRLVIPVGSRYEQELLLVIKRGERLVTKDLGPCRFVPLVGEDAWSED